MCAASQQIDVIPNQGHDGTRAGKNLGLMFARASLPPLFTLSPAGFDAELHWAGSRREWRQLGGEAGGEVEGFGSHNLTAEN